MVITPEKWLKEEVVIRPITFRSDWSYFMNFFRVIGLIATHDSGLIATHDSGLIATHVSGLITTPL